MPSKPMKVLRVLNRFSLGGPMYNAAFLTKNLAPEFETLLIGGRRNDDEQNPEFLFREMGIEYREIPEMGRSIRLRNDRTAYLKIRETIREFNPAIVHTHAAKSGALGRLAAVKEKVPLIIHTFHGHVFHSYFNPAISHLFVKIERYLARRTDQVIAISPLQEQEISEVFRICSKDKISVIPLGFDLQKFTTDSAKKRTEFRREFGIADSQTVVSIVGRLAPIKNHQLFVDVAGQLKSRGYKFIIIGDGNSRTDLDERARGLGLRTSFSDREEADSDLVFAGWRHDIDKVYAGSDILALTSLNEGTPVTAIEALASAKPVVATNVGGVADVVADGQSGFLSDSQNIDQFCDRIVQLAEDKQLRQKFGEFGRASVMEKYSYTRLVAETKDLYHRLLNRQ